MERKKKMKKSLKSVISGLLTLMIFAAALTVTGIVAAAESKLSIAIDHDYYGAAFVNLIPGDSDNYVTYTTDGTAPKSDSQKFEEEIVLYEKTNLRVAEYTPEGERVKGLKTTVNVKVAPVTFKVKQLGGEAEVTMSCMTEGAEIRYTTDGSKPSKDSELYTGKLSLTEKTKIRTRAYCDGYKTTTTYSQTVKIMSVADEEPAEEKKSDEGQAAVKTGESEKESEDKKESDDKKDDTPSEKVYANQKISYKVTYMNDGETKITLTPAKNGYTIRYTTDGSTPTYKTGKKYKSRISFSEPTILRVRQYNSKGQCMGTLKLNVKVKCANVIFNCVSMDTGIREIEMYCPTPGTTIYYTTNGTNPRYSDARVYTEPVFASSMADIMAYAARDGYKDSSITWEIAGNVKMQLTRFDFSDHQFTLGADTLNSYRRANGLTELKLDENLTKAANLRAHEVSINYSSTRPSGTNYTSIFSQYNITSVFSAEYIERHHDNAREFINDVLSNENNKQRILSNAYDYTKIGIG